MNSLLGLVGDHTLYSDCKRVTKGTSEICIRRFETDNRIIGPGRWLQWKGATLALHSIEADILPVNFRDKENCQSI